MRLLRPTPSNRSLSTLASSPGPPSPPASSESSPPPAATAAAAADGSERLTWGREPFAGSPVPPRRPCCCGVWLPGSPSSSPSPSSPGTPTCSPTMDWNILAVSVKGPGRAAGVTTRLPLPWSRAAAASAAAAARAATAGAGGSSASVNRSLMSRAVKKRRWRGSCNTLLVR